MIDTQEIFTAHDVADVLAASPTFFGFELKESFVAVATYGKRRRFGFRVRIDMPEAEHLGHAAERVVAHLRHQKADGAILLAFCEDRARGRTIIEKAYTELDRHGIEPIVLAWADGRRYWEPEPHYRPRGRRYELSPHHLSVVQAVAAGQEIVADRSDLVERFAPCTGPLRERMLGVSMREFERIVAIFGRTTDAEGLVDAAVAELDPIFDLAVVQGERLSDRDVAIASVWMSSVAVRDEIWSRIVPDSASGWWRVLHDMSLRVVPPFEPSVLSLAGFAAWMTGDGTQALIALERSLSVDPQHSLTTILLEGLQGGVSPSVLGQWQLERRWSA